MKAIPHTGEECWLVSTDDGEPIGRVIGWQYDKSVGCWDPIAMRPNESVAFMCAINYRIVFGHRICPLGGKWEVVES